MNEAFKKRQMLFVVQLSMLTGILLLLHSHLLNSFEPDSSFVIPVWTIYLFHAITILMVYSVINFRFSNGRTSVFNYFIALMILKMIVVVIFLLPLFFSKSSNKILEAVNFFVPYFVFLAFEVYSINKFLVTK